MTRVNPILRKNSVSIDELTVGVAMAFIPTVLVFPSSSHDSDQPMVGLFHDLMSHVFPTSAGKT